ncbi:Tyrosine-protein kinase receptor torso [Strongyloides ratti]|uniref:receptor protein-tyrosine kinase n=1 Tax=Strongyloides ratti TaxID=34506 RepID=A0A090KU43_STRRB|nr:Tyrosine-protein kinase receptor torso [Strongyloides ratti]CEF60941.1 Tyrosine-protein kinase receptor torso [Strongyloides ratti]
MKNILIINIIFLIFIYIIKSDDDSSNLISNQNFVQLTSSEKNLISKGYCDLRECKNWSGVILIILSPLFPIKKFPPIINFIWDTFNDCQTFGGEVFILPTNANNDLPKVWSSTKNELKNNFDTIFDEKKFIVSSFPLPTFIENVLNNVTKNFYLSPLANKTTSIYGKYLMIITNYEIYLDQETSFRIRNNIKHNQVRLKIMLIDKYNDDFDSMESDEDFFEMIAERGEKTEVDDVDGLTTSKMPSKMGACHNYQPFPKPLIDIKKSNKKGIIVGVILGGGGFLLILSILIFICIRWRRKIRKDKISTLSWINSQAEQNRINEYKEHNKNKVLNNLMPIYNDNYNDQNQVNEINKNIEITEDRKILESVLTINYNEKLGSGAFSSVYKGAILLDSHFIKQKLNFINNKIKMKTIFVNEKKNCNNEETVEIDVAVKTELKNENVFQNAESKEFLLKEINTLLQISDHPHVITFWGSCFKDSSLCLVLEYCENGDLQTWLRNPSNKKYIDIKRLLSFSWQISDGMYYLAVKNLIHRDLAARNILLDGDLVAKISDFGLSRVFDTHDYDIEMQNEYMLRTNAKIPVKHTAIEALRDGVYTEKSDVWAYGVLLFEIFSLGSIPYETLSLVEILPFLANGSRLPRPLLVTDSVWEIIEKCWLEDPKDRPNFNEIRTNLTKLLEEVTIQYGYIELGEVNVVSEDDEVQV